MADVDDLLIVGAGPAGISAAINAASEGLRVRVLESASSPGGQAKESFAIENYPGFPEGITGMVLMDRLVRQAEKFGVQFNCPVNAQKLQVFHQDENFLVMSDDFQTFASRAVLLAMGLQYRRLQAQNVGHFMGRGVYYGIPSGVIPHNKPCRIAIVGGANSAGQAAVKLAENSKHKVRLVIRKTIDTQMSKYLITKIKGLANIEVCENCEVIAVGGRTWLETIRAKYTEVTLEHRTDYLIIFIGAVPKTLWLDGTIELDGKFFVQPNGDHPYQTNVPGVFVVGDIRASSVKRIASSSGEGSMVVPYIHQYLARGAT